MTKRMTDWDDRPILDIASYARRGVAKLTRPELDLLVRTARRVPEVMVKITGGGNRVAGVQRHLQYIDRHGSLDVETDAGVFRGPGYEKTLLTDWDLDLEERPKAREFAGAGRKPKKLVHNLIFSMPPGTDPQKVLDAVRQVAKNEWMFKHRFALALHTDEPHPHVHVVIKARSEQGKRLNIRKSTLRSWRQQFAHQLREMGVPANATERLVRGATSKSRPDGMYRAAERGEIIRWQRAATESTSLHRNATAKVGLQSRIKQSRQKILDGWRNVRDDLLEHGEHKLAESVRAFLRQIKTEHDKDEQAILVQQNFPRIHER